MGMGGDCDLESSMCLYIAFFGHRIDLQSALMSGSFLNIFASLIVLFCTTVSYRKFTLHSPSSILAFDASSRLRL